MTDLNELLSTEKLHFTGFDVRIDTWSSNIEGEAGYNFPQHTVQISAPRTPEGKAAIDGIRQRSLGAFYNVPNNEKPAVQERGDDYVLAYTDEPQGGRSQTMIREARRGALSEFADKAKAEETPGDFYFQLREKARHEGKPPTATVPFQNIESAFAGSISTTKQTGRIKDVLDALGLREKQKFAGVPR